LLRFWRATINSRNGLAFAFRSERAIREEVVALALSLPLAWLVGATMMRRVELVAATASPPTTIRRSDGSRTWARPLSACRC
jgi:diacylglycerol kinase